MKPKPKEREAFKALLRDLKRQADVKFGRA